MSITNPGEITVVLRQMGKARERVAARLGRVPVAILLDDEALDHRIEEVRKNDAETFSTLRQAVGEIRAARERLAALMKPELDRLASRFLRQESPGHGLETGDLVDEIYLKLQPEIRSFNDSVHLKAYAAWLMRRKLIDLARKRASRGHEVSLEGHDAASYDRAIWLLELEEALAKLREVDDRAAQVVVLRFYGGLTWEEIAAALTVNVSTAKRDWKMARTQLNKGEREKLEQALDEETLVRG
jgi:RNA polymerase sigma factor (TIGR02999 family)